MEKKRERLHRDQELKWQKFLKESMVERETWLAKRREACEEKRGKSSQYSREYDNKRMLEESIEEQEEIAKIEMYV